MRRRTRSVASTEGSALRALLWLLVGLAVLVGLIVLSAPEIAWTSPGVATEVLLVAAMTGIPGLVLLLWIAFRRRGREEQRPSEHPEGHPDQRPPRQEN